MDYKKVQSFNCFKDWCKRYLAFQSLKLYQSKLTCLIIYCLYLFKHFISSSRELSWSFVRPSVKFSYFYLLQNNWCNVNRTWHKISLGEGDSSLFKWRPHPFLRKDYNEIAKIYGRNSKIFSRITWQVSIFVTNHQLICQEEMKGNALS